MRKKIVMLSFIFLWATAVSALAKGFVAEATRVVDDVRRQSTSANQAFEDFYREFNRYASKMVDLEARVERWKKEGYLCEKYQDCPEKWDAVFAQYELYMREIEQVFHRYRPKIQQAVAEFHRRVYEGLDRIRDLRLAEPTVGRERFKNLRQRQLKLDREREELERVCPRERVERECLRRWRAFNRKARQLNLEIQRTLFLVKLARLKLSIASRLETVLTALGDIEERTTSALSYYAMLFSEYEDLAGSSGVGALIQSIQDLKVLNQKLKDLETFSQGLQQHVMEMGKLLDKRLALTEQRLNLGEEASSATEEITRYTQVLEQNQELLDELSRELETEK